jgi:hypothetical protein
MTLSPPECLVVSILLMVPAAIVMAVCHMWFGGAENPVFWVAWVVGLVGTWFGLQSLTREWVYTDEDIEPKK